MTDLTDKLADALEDICKNYDCDTSEGGKHFPERCRCCIAESALLVYRAQRDGEEKCDEGYRWLKRGEPIQEGDEFHSGSGEWVNYGMRKIGEPFHPALDFPTRRPLAKGEA